MATQITFPTLMSINDNVNMAFNDQLFSAETVFDKFCFQATSTGDAEVYPRLDMLKGLREWIGDRQVNSLTQETFRITNKWFEETIGISRSDIEDDKFNLLGPMAAQLGLDAARLPDRLVATLLKGGHTTPCYDGQNFFDTAHPNYNADGSAGTALNYVAGSSPVWFLFCTRERLRPVIFQRRKPFQVIPKFSMTDPEVFWHKEFEWGVDGRCNVGFGIWQLGFMSFAPLTIENIAAARATMMSYRRPDGTPMGLSPDLLVTGSANFPAAKALAEQELVPNTLSTTFTTSGTVTMVPNVVRGLFKPLENPWLN